MPAGSSAPRVERAHLHIPSWLIAAVVAAAVATGATVLIEQSGGSDHGAAVQGGSLSSQPTTCLQPVVGHC